MTVHCGWHISYSELVNLHSRADRAEHELARHHELIEHLARELRWCLGALTYESYHARQPEHATYKHMAEIRQFLREVGA